MVVNFIANKVNSFFDGNVCKKRFYIVTYIFSSLDNEILLSVDGNGWVLDITNFFSVSDFKLLSLSYNNMCRFGLSMDEVLNYQ